MTASRIVVIGAVAGLYAAAIFGQAPPPATGATDPNSPQQVQPADGRSKSARDTSQNQGTRNNQNGTPAAKPNSDTTDNTENADQNDKAPKQGPEIPDDENATPEQKASAEYSGPAVLSRGISASEPMNPKNVRLTPSVGLEFMVNSGLTGVAPQANGQPSNQFAEGVQLTYGLTGEKVYKKDVFGLDFSGNLYHYTQAGFDGTSDQLSLTWRHRLTRHISFGIRESLQEYNNNNLLLSGSQLINTGVGTTLVTASPTTEAFDGRVFTLYNEGDITWQVSPRLSFNFSGAGFFTRRASSSLYGDTGYQAGADVAYRWNRRVTVGLYYGYTHFDFNGIYGGTDVNTVGITYSMAFNASTQLITRIGGSRLETTGLQSVDLNPFLASLLGTPSTIEAIYSRNYVPDLNIQLRRKVSHVNLSLAYARGVTPGNGVILTSVAQNVSFGVNYKAGRLWNLAGTGGYDTLSSFGVSNLKYASVFLGTSVYRTVYRNLDWHVRVDFHHYTFDNTGFLRNTFVLATGLVWAPGNVMERPW